MTFLALPVEGEIASEFAGCQVSKRVRTLLARLFLSHRLSVSGSCYGQTQTPARLSLSHDEGPATSHRPARSSKRAEGRVTKPANKRSGLLLVCLCALATFAAAWAFAVTPGEFNDHDYGAVGDGKNLDNPAINKAVVAASFAGGAYVAVAGKSDCLKIERRQLRVVVGKEATQPERRAVELFAAEVHRRTGLDVAVGDKTSAKHTLVVGTAKSSTEIASYVKQHPQSGKLETDGFYLATVSDKKGRLYVVGQSPSGLVAGIGKLLRLSRYADGALEIPRLTLSDHPRMPVRGMYFATHFDNFYHVAPLEEVDRIIEELALWGANSLCVWFDMHHFKSMQEPAAQEHLARLKHFGETARKVGMQFGLTFLANEAYADSPKHLRPKPAHGSYGVELCPSIPEGLALIGKWQAEELDAFGPVDFIWLWPYDQGGCACDKCKPWGGNGFLVASEQLARLYRERFPQGKVWLSTWYFDRPPYCSEGGDYDPFFQCVREKKPTWFDGIIVGSDTKGHISKQLLEERPYPERYPLVSFPEISMHMLPWGGYGADPLPEYNERSARELRSNTAGGWPYSEGIFEDASKFFWVQFHWNPARTADEIHAEYAAYYLGPESAEEAVWLFRLMEKAPGGFRRDGLRLKNTGEGDESWTLAQKIDSRLAPWAKASWRWRILYVRAAVDRIARQMTNRHTTPAECAALEPLRAELARIYRGNWVFPMPFPPPSALPLAGPPPAGSAIRIDAGSTTNFTDAAGNVWLSDRGFDGGECVVREHDMQIENTKDAGIYRTEHWGMSSFSQPLPNGKYVAKLHFAETYDGITGPGERVFSFNVESRAFKDFDVWVKAGGPRRAFVETVNVDVTDGKLDITFESGVDEPEINGIEIIPAL